MAINSWSRNRKLSLSWMILFGFFISSAIVLITLSLHWTGTRSTLNAHTLQSLVWTSLFANISLVLGIFISIAAIIGLAGFYQGFGSGNGDKNRGLTTFNVALVATLITTVIAGSIIWFYTLTERADYEKVWIAQPLNTQVYLQNTLSCCGYWNATTAGLLVAPTGFCSKITNATAVTPCITPIIAYADTFLNNIFTTIYGFSAIEIFLFLTTSCLIINRAEEERFRRIDKKRGIRGGFV